MMNPKRKQPLSFLLMTVFIFAGLPVRASGAALPRLAEDAVILAFGDSLTHGTGAAPGESYPAVLERLIGRRVVNEGIPGEMTGEGMARLPEALKRVKPALLILCHGANDLLRGRNKRQAAANLRAMIRQARQTGIAVVLIAVPTPGLSLSPEPLYREIAREMDLAIEEKALSLVLSDRALLSDTIHPNAAGYRTLAESIASLLKKSGAVK